MRARLVATFGAIGILLAARAPARADAAAAPAVVEPLAADPNREPPPHEIGLGAIQLGVGYVAEVGGVAGLFALGLYPKALGFHSEGATLGMVAVLAPAFAAGAVCGVGYFSRWYRGRCVPTLLGAYAGMVAGALIGIALAPEPGPDDTSAFVQSISGIAGALLFIPVGAVAGYHIGKQELPAPRPD